jgi:hypothetical protein
MTASGSQGQKLDLKSDGIYDLLDVAAFKILSFSSTILLPASIQMFETFLKASMCDLLLCNL